MIAPLLEWFSWVPPELATILLAALPITELRAALPIAMTLWDLSAVSALTFSVLGNWLPILFIYTFLPLMIQMAAKHSVWFDRVLQGYFGRLRGKHAAMIERYGAVALAIFVAIPLPGTGTWTAAVLAVLFGVHPAKGIPAMAIGSVVAGLLILLLIQGVLKFF